MKLTYLSAIIVSSFLTIGTATVVGNIQPAHANPCAAQVNPCAANPCAANPCAANPCAANPCAANPCAAQVNPCAANPCAANPCAANPCAGASTGAFEGVAHPTSGAARIVEENGKRYLEFDAAFRSDSGPDLLVLLHQETVPQSYSSNQYVSLGFPSIDRGQPAL